MFEVNDLVMYGSTGVCRVEDIRKPDFDGLDMDSLYYILQPLYQDGTIYAPVDNKTVFMRSVISEDEANGLIDSIPDVHTEVFKGNSVQQLTKHYQSVIDTHKCMDLIRLTKSIRKKKAQANKQNRRLGQIDKKFMRRAEELLFGEFAAALNISMDDVGEYIERRIGEENV